MARIALIPVVLLAAPSFALAQADKPAPVPAPAAAPAPPARPAFKPLRFEEDWSKFDPATGDELFDPLKRISLNDDGSAYASFGGELRLRLESWWAFNFNDISANDDVFALGRALAHLDVHLSKSFRFYVEGKSAGLLEDRKLPGGRRTLDVDNLDLQNAFADIVFGLDDNVSLTARIGRQELLFGKQRLVSPLPWANTKRTWDAARAILKFDNWRIDGFYSRYAAVQKYDFNDWSIGPDFFGAYAAGKIGDGPKPWDLDLYWLGLDADRITFNGTTGHESRHTVGARLGGPFGDSGFDMDLEGMYQFGSLADADISAYAFASQLGYNFSGTTVSPRLYIGFDYASGDDTPADGKAQTFNQLFPLGHAYFGFMDFVGRQNIIDLSTGFSIKPVPALTLRTDLHFFWRASTDDALYNAGGGVVRAGALATSREVGQEFDITATWKVDHHLEIEGGYAHFFAGDFISDSGPGDDMDWVYVQATFKF